MQGDTMGMYGIVLSLKYPPMGPAHQDKLRPLKALRISEDETIETN